MSRFLFPLFQHTITVLYRLTKIETKEEAESGKGVDTCEHVVALPVMTLVASITLVIRRSYRVLGRLKHDLVAGWHTLLMMMMMMVGARHHLMMRLLVVLMMHTRVARVVARALIHVFPSD